MRIFTEDIYFCGKRNGTVKDRKEKKMRKY